MSVVYNVVPQEKIGIGLGVWGLSAALGPAVGPTLGGYLVDSLGWPWIFGINIPVGIIGSLLAFYFLKETPLKKGIKLDIGGAFFIALGCFCLLLALSEGQDHGWTSQYIVTLLIVAVYSLALFICWEIYHPDPLIDISLFKNPILLCSTLLTVFTTVGMLSFIFIIPVYAQNLLGYSPTDTGLMMLPMALVTGLMMPVGGKLFDRFGAAGIGVVGLIISTG
jgi:EmrB/QacA subfamily drug resistance transporter